MIMSPFERHGRFDVSIVVPVYRNADTLKELHRRLCNVLEERKLEFEIVFVDDACPAGSLEVLTALADRDPRVGVLVLRSNYGQNQAVLTGLTYVRGRWAIVMDADLQDPPEAVPELLSKGEEGYSAVFAGRRGRYESFGRLFTSRLFKKLLHLLCGVPSDGGIFVALSQQMRERLIVMKGPSPFVVAMIGCTRLPSTSIPVTRAPRASGKSAYTFVARLKSARRAILWILAWKWRRLVREPLPWKLSDAQTNGAGHSSRVSNYLGARFQPPVTG